MAEHNEILEGRFNEAVSRSLGMEERSPAPVLAPEIIPVVIVSSLDVDSNRMLKKERLGWGGDVVAALAANFSMVQIFNPVNSGVAIEVHDVVTTILANGTQVVFRLTSTAIGAAVANADIQRDTRWSPANFALGLAGQVRSAQAGLPGANIVLQGRPRNALRTEFWKLGCILGPGSGIFCSPSAVNIDMEAWYRWTERPLNPSERVA